MKLTCKEPGRLPKTDLLIVLAVEGRKPVLATGVDVPTAFKRSVDEGARKARHTFASKGPAERVMVLSLGKRDKIDAETFRRAGAIAAKRAEGMGAASAAVWVGADIAKLGGGPESAGCGLAEGATLGAYKYTQGKSKSDAPKLKSVTLYGSGKTFQRGVKRGQITAAANAFTRDLQNSAGNQMTPRDMAAAARKLAGKSDRITCKVMDEKAMERMGMGLLLSVSQGSTEPARLIHLTYKPRGRARGKVALVGKGLTFDAGGISLKPPATMDEMRFDMSGGATVLGVFHALTQMDVPYEVHGVVPSSENLPDGKATKPGDVFAAMNGKTVEVLNTDAEGRLILADALCYTEAKIKPDTIIDLATLTGAVVMGLGHEVSGMFTTTDRLRDDLISSGDEVGEVMWPLPLLEPFKEAMKGVVADLKNIGPSSYRGGSIQGAAFLSHFVGEDTEWAHLDIAGSAWGGIDRDWVGGPQGSGVGTRMLIHYLETRR